MIVALLLLWGCADAPPPAAPPEPTGTSSKELEARRKAINAKLKALVGDLAAQDRYDCCVKVPCSTCALYGGGCKCGEGLRRGEPVCDECAFLWLRGEGAEDVDPATVKSFQQVERELKGMACACPEHAEGATGATPRPRPPRTAPAAPGTSPP